MLTALIDYKSGNLHSAVKAFEKIADENTGRRRIWLEVLALEN